MYGPSLCRPTLLWAEMSSYQIEKKLTTGTDFLLDNQVVISEYRNSCYRKCLCSLIRKWVSERLHNLCGSAETLFVYLMLYD